MGLEHTFFIAAIIIGFYMAWNIGANDMANSMASAVGAEAITLKQAIFIGSILCFIGATFAGSKVTETIQKGIVDPSGIDNLEIVIKGLLASLVAASLWITLSTWFAWPVSTTHSIVGALVGFGFFVSGPASINWQRLTGIVISWVASPLFAGVLGFILFRIISKYILSVDEREKASLRIIPVFIGLALFMVASSLFFKTPIGQMMKFNTTESLVFALIIAFIGTVFGFFGVRRAIRRKRDTEDIFKLVQIMTSCYVAFSIGTNDVANAMGPVAGIFNILKENTLRAQVEIPITLLALGGFGIAVGIFTWGYRVIETVGRKITHLTNSRGFSIDFAAATSVLLASRLGMPVSTTHAVIGAVCGIGLARGLDAVDFRVVRKIVISWIATVPAAAVTCILFFKLFMWLF
jgi:inorganic phosphate transporter, PiT family